MSHEVHVVGTDPSPVPQLEEQLKAFGFEAVAVTGSHPALASGCLYSAYDDSAAAAAFHYRCAVDYADAFQRWGCSSSASA